MRPPDPEITPIERAALNADVARFDAGTMRQMPKSPDFEYLCSVAETAGWHVHLTLGKEIARYSSDECRSFALGSIRLKRNATATAKIAVPVDEDLGLASRIALDKLLAAVKKS